MLSVKIYNCEQRFSNLASDWLVAEPTTNQSHVLCNVVGKCVSEVFYSMHRGLSLYSTVKVLRILLCHEQTPFTFVQNRDSIE